MGVDGPSSNSSSDTAAIVGRGERLFVGRQRQLSAILGCLREAEGGRGRLVLITGEPGIGKTRFAEEIVASAQRRNAVALWGRCWEGGGAPPYWAWAQVIRNYFAKHESVDVTRILGPAAPFIARLLPEAVSHLRSNFETMPRHLAESDYARFQFFDAFANFLRRASWEKTLLIVLDDVHAADPSSLLLLEFVSRSLVDSRVIITATYREQDIRRREDLAHILHRVASDSMQVALKRLSREHVRVFLERAFDSAIDDRIVDQVYRQTDGHPFFLTAVSRILLSQDGLPSGRDALALPDEVRQAIRGRLLSVSEETLAILRTASIVGKEFDTNVLLPLCNLRRSDLVARLGEAATQGLIDDIDGNVRRWRFAHTLIRDTLYEDQPEATRMIVHERVGDALEAVQHRGVSVHASELAHHFLRAMSPRALAKAVLHAKHGGDRAMEQFAYEEAIDQYRQAIHALGMQPSASEGERCRLLLELARAQSKAGDLPAANQTLREAAVIARQVRDSESLARAALGFAPLQDVGMNEDRVCLLEEALRGVGGEDSVLRASLLARLAETMWMNPDLQRRLTLSREAVDMARRMGDGATIWTTLKANLITTWAPDNLEERIATARELVRLATQLRNPEWLCEAHFWSAAQLAELEDIGPLDIELAALRGVRQGDEQPFLQWITKLTLAMRVMPAGRFSEAQRCMEEARATGQKFRFPEVDAVFATQKLVLDWLRGTTPDVAEVNGVYERVPFPYWRAQLAIAHMNADLLDDARRDFEILAAADFTDLWRDQLWIPTLTLCAEVCVSLGDTRRAAILYDLLLPFVNRIAVLPFANAYLGPVTRFLGLLAGTLHRFADAAGHFEEARSISRNTGSVAWLTHAECDYARMLVMRDAYGDRENTHELLQRTIDASQALGMLRLAAKAKELMQGVGRAVHPRTSGGGSRAGVFRCDGDYWTLVFEGREIRLRSVRGLQYIAHLISHPNREFHVAELAAQGMQPDVRHASQGAVRRGTGHAGEILDGRARKEYQRRLSELRAESEQARDWGDQGRAEALQKEIEVLTLQLRSALGLRGRAARAADGAQRARKAVSNRIRAAIGRISAACPGLGDHLKESIRTGIVCSYVPYQIIDWTL